MFIFVQHVKNKHCLHTFFAPEDEVEFDFRDRPDLAEAFEVPPSLIRAHVVETSCNDLLVQTANGQYIVASNCGDFVRLISASRDYGLIKSGCRSLGIK